MNQQWMWEQARRAAQAVDAGGCLIYPTETFYALGCGAFRADALARTAALKGRPEGKPLPLVIGAREQLALVTDSRDPTLVALAGTFWPGPLAVLVPAVPGLPAAVRSADGLVAVRQTPHPLAALICRLACTPLAATSANRSGQPPAAAPSDLDPGLLAAVDAALLDPPWPAGGLPSTLVTIAGPHRLRLLRAGPVTVELLEAAGFCVEPAAV